MAHTTLVMGVDGGATKTVGIIVDQNLNVLARQKVGPTNPNFAGLEKAARELAHLIRICSKEAHCSPPDLRLLLMGLAGAGDDANRRRIRQAVNELLHSDRGTSIPIAVENDARVALEGAFDGGEGVVIVAGTGSNVMGKLAGGGTVGAGGWGRVFGDEGSGYLISADALRAVARDYDGRGRATMLRERLEKKYGWKSGEAIVAAVYRESFDVPSLAPLVFEAAVQQDPVSLEILNTNASLLADQTVAVIRKMGPQHRIGIVFTGSLINHDSLYAGMLRDEIRLRCAEVEFRKALHPPAYGAALMALRKM